jgi:hypothetical protein
VQGEGAAPVESIGAFALDGYEPSQGTAASPGQSGGGGGGGLVGGVLSAVAEHELCGLTPPCGGCGATCSEFPYPEEDPDNPEVGRGWCSEQSADPTCVRCIGCPGAEIARPGGGAGGGGACGGQEGMSGTSGGASVGVIAEGVLLQFQDVHISADAGGRGGNGGNGGLAAPGECGGLGAQGSCVLAEASLCSSGPLGGVPRRVMQCRRGGEAGGNGGRGGPGGNGAGGSGGPSIGVVLLDGASLEETGSLYETEPSDPGEGGMTGSTPGPSGEPGMGEACWPSDTCP